MEIKDFKIEIDLKDVYVGYGDNDDGQDVNEAIKNEIQRQVLDKMIKSFSPEVVKALKDEMVAKYNDQFGEKINSRIERAIKYGVFSTKNGTFNVDEYVKQRFEIAINNSTFSAQVDKMIKTRIEAMQKALQDRYDLAFASGIIKNLKDGNLLREGAEKLLLNETK